MVDAWRIESADDGEEQGLLASAYQFSHPAGAPGCRFRYSHRGSDLGSHSYGIYGACMAIGMIATWFAKEPELARRGDG